MSSVNPGKNIVFSGEEKHALYIEGVRCAYSEAEILIEDGMIPRMNFTVPATPYMRKIGRRARVHFIIEPPAPDGYNEGVPFTNLRVFFEGELSGFGLQKSPESKYLSFNVNHVTAHLDQYEISALDSLAFIDALLNGSSAVETKVSTVTGNVLELFTAENLVAILKHYKQETVKPDQLSVRDFVWASFFLYRDLFAVSRLGETYTNDAIRFHQLVSRIQTPHPKLLNWGTFQNGIMSAFLSYGLQAVGGKMSYLELLRQVCQYFLYQVTVLPNAESVTKQIQVKPATQFNAIPKCNVIYPSMHDTYAYQEDWDSKPTRMRAIFMPSSLSPSADIRTIQRHFTVYAPNELQWRWNQILLATKKPDGAPAAGTRPVKEMIAGELKPPKDKIPFVTQEEDSRGIVHVDYPLPPMLNYTIMSQISTTERKILESAQVSTAGLDEDKATEAIYASMKAGDPASRALKYRAFLCMALGSSGGIKNGRIKGSSVKYPKAPQELRRLAGVVTDPDLPYFAPSRLAYMPVPLKIDADNLHSTHAAEVFNTGVNYLVTKTGLIVEVVPRDFHLFGEAKALPLGITVSGFGQGEAAELNNRIPPLGVSYKDWRSQFEFVTNDLVTKSEHLQTLWQALAKTDPIPQQSDWFAIDTHPNSINHTAKSTAFNAGLAERIEKGKTTVSMWLSGQPVTSFVIQEYVRVSETLFFFRIPRAFVPVGFAVNLKISTKITEPNVKPWLAHLGGKSVSAQALNQIENNSLADRGVQGGPVGTVVIGFEGSGGALTAAQIASGAFLTACIQETTATNVGTLKSPPGRAGRAFDKLTDDAIKDAADYYGRTVDPSTSRLDAGAVSDMKRKAAVIGDALFKDFNAWDDELTKGSPEPITPTIDASGVTPDDTTLPPDDRFDAGDYTPPVAGASTTPTQAAQGFKDLDFNYGTLEKIISEYMAPYLNVQFHNVRLAPQSFGGNVAWNPYMLVGYPCLLLDTSHTGYDLVGYLHAVRFRFTPTSVQQQATYTHLRPSLGKTDVGLNFGSNAVERREAMIPFKDAVSHQYIFVFPSDKKEAYKSPAAYKDMLEKNSLYIPKTNFPIQLHSIDSKQLPPFMYGGGFGLNESGVQPGSLRGTINYDTYAVYVGFNEAKNAFKAAANPEENCFIFADTIDVKLDRSLNITQAYQQVKRGIQRVGQNNLAWAEASVVAMAGEFEAEAVAGNATLARVQDGLGAVDSEQTTASTKLTDEIKVYQTPPEYDATGKKIKEGVTFVFDTQIRAMVRAHNTMVREHWAIPSEDVR